MCGQVVTIALRIKNASEKPQRVTFATINCEMRARLALNLNLSKMPLTATFFRASSRLRNNSACGVSTT